MKYNESAGSVKARWQTPNKGNLLSFTSSTFCKSTDLTAYVAYFWQLINQ